jgi:hypothetical protein
VWIFSDFKGKPAAAGGGGETFNYIFGNDCADSEPKECRRTLEFTKGIKIKDVYLDGTPASSGDKINILFKRPNPDAIIVKEPDTADNKSSACIEIQSKDGVYTSAIFIGTAGDISVIKKCN